MVQNLPRTNTCTNQAAQWSRPLVPGTMPLSRSASARPKNSTFIRKMPSSAKPRTTSRVTMRSPSPTGVSTVAAPAAMSVVVPALAVHVAVLDLLGRCLAHVDDLDVEVQVLAGHRVVEVHVQQAHAHLVDGHRARAEVGVEHHLHPRCELRVAEMLLRHALGHALALLAVGLGRGHVHLEAVARLAPFHRLLQPRDDVAVPGEDRQRLAPLGTLHVAAVLDGHGVMEADDAVFLDLHGWARSLRMGTHYPRSEEHTSEL